MIRLCQGCVLLGVLVAAVGLSGLDRGATLPGVFCALMGLWLWASEVNFEQRAARLRRRYPNVYDREDR